MLPRAVSLILCLLLGVSKNGGLGKPGRVMVSLGAPQCHWDSHDVVEEQVGGSRWVIQGPSKKGRLQPKAASKGVKKQTAL